MQRLTRGSGLVWCLFALVSAALVAAGHAFVLQRAEHAATRYLTIRGDSTFYLDMVNASGTHPPPPFRYRVLVPFLASMLPLRAPDALRAVSYASLFIAYLSILMSGRALRLPPGAAIAGLLVAFASAVHLYNYHNPFLTDAFWIMIACVMVQALITNSLPLFVAAALAGVLARESALLLAPLWCIRSFRAGLWVVAAAVVSSAVLAGAMTSAPAGLQSSLGAAVEVAHARIQNPLRWAADVALAWGIQWPLMLAGLFHFQEERRLLAPATAIMMVAALVTSCIATDAARMFGTLMPIMAMGCAGWVNALRSQSPAWPALLIAFVCVQAAVALPNAVCDEQSPLFATPWPRLGVLAGGTLYVLQFCLRQRRSNGSPLLIQR